MITGGCHCGAIRLTINGEPIRSALCACTDCRRSSGTPAVAWSLFPRDAVSIDGDPAIYNSSRDVRRGFCSRCGTGLFYESASVLPGKINMRSASFDQLEVVSPMAWVQMADAPEWLHHAGDLPKFERYSGR